MKMEEKDFEPAGLIPRSIIRTVERFQQQLRPETVALGIQEFRISRYQVRVSVRYFFILLLLPISLNWGAKNLIIKPLVGHFWNTYQTSLFLNNYQAERAFQEMRDFESQLFFEMLLLPEETKSTELGLEITNFNNKKKNINICNNWNSSSMGFHRHPSILADASMGNYLLGAKPIAFVPKDLEPSEALSKDFIPKPFGLSGGTTFSYNTKEFGKTFKNLDLQDFQALEGLVSTGSYGVGILEPKTPWVVCPKEVWSCPKGTRARPKATRPNGNGKDIVKGEVIERVWGPKKLPSSDPQAIGATLENLEIQEAHLRPVLGTSVSGGLLVPQVSWPPTLWQKIRPWPIAKSFIYNDPKDLDASNLCSYEASRSIITPYPQSVDMVLTHYPIIEEDTQSLTLSSEIHQKLYILALLNPTTPPPQQIELCFRALFQKKTALLAETYNQQSITALSNLFGDCIMIISTILLIRWNAPQFTILKSFLIESFYSFNDAIKCFYIILITDFLVGFHSPRGWEIAMEMLLRHLGLPENEEFILLFVGTFPVFLDTAFKYWIFRYLNKISPSTVATYHNMIE